MNKCNYIDVDKLIAEIERRIKVIAKAPSDNGGVMDSINGARGHELMRLLSFLSTLEEPAGKVNENVAERFARIVRENLSEIGNNAQSQFEQLYFEITGNKMYGGYND